ncbi:NosD domain-containing protein [Natrarchaeobius oligotrophus]|uniref:Nitrous oxide reductase accessory protein NosL/NosD n=1 Tax=Natrarchaeobius chitinivorans TaxID=1679083 RepID=A0A3N6MEU5_NATCH|nr:NosD domain-containing protein [Natrarchaeobius chitinivorans]RQH02524.1 nitrous oxide reductase accessory protein NosL/NosD [Natrarchaeobius chitinivorans]
MIERQRIRLLVVAILVAIAVVAVGVFVVDGGTADPDPVLFDDTVSMGLALEDEYGLEDDVRLPRAQVFYSQYEYVVGYYGVEMFVASFREAGHTDRFGHPRTVYVSDYSSVDVELSADGHPTADREPAWTDAESAWFAVGSEATTPSGQTIVPFADRDDATAFVDSHGGSVVAWEQLLDRDVEMDDATVVRDRVDQQHQNADERIEAVSALADRPVSTVVGEDAATVQEAIDSAPENTTVLVPEGTYNETLEVDRSITLRGEDDATIRGDGNGTVITATANRTAAVGLAVAGSGSQRQGDGELPGDEHDGEWDDTFERNYAGSDAAIGLHTANESLIEDVSVDSEVTGVVLRRSENSVVRDVTVDSPERWEDGHAGVLAFHSPTVVENATISDGRDGVYSHRSTGLVVRNSTLEGNRLGVHLMHTSDALLASNRLENQSSTGIYVMTGPERNAIVDNEIRGAEYGLFPDGSDSYVADNLLVDNRVGLRIDATGSRYEGNVVAGNEIGAQVRAMLPTNQVLENDFVENDVHADAGTGPLRVWTHDGTGNYWQGASSITGDRTVDGPYSPTAPVDRQLHRTDGAETLARSPALDAISGLQGTVPGMRTGSVVDLAPTCEPNEPDLLAETPWADRAWSCERIERGPSP